VHEMGLCQAIVEATLRRAAGRPVRAVRVRVGGHPVDPQVIAQGFRMAAAGTYAEGAELDLVVEPQTAHCRSCGADSPVTAATVLVACPRCGGLDMDAPLTEQLVVESIAISEDEPAASGRGDSG